MERGKTHKTMATILVISLFLVATNPISTVQAKTYSFTATISPTQGDVSQPATYTVTITNTGIDSTLGSASMAIPAGFTVLPPATIVTPPSSWTCTLSDTAITLTGNSGSAPIDPGQNVTFTFTATSPDTPGVTTWTIQATTNIDGGGVVIPIEGAYPTVTVISPLSAPTISASPSTINQGQASLLSQSTTALGGTQPYAYQWLEAFNGGPFSPIAGASGPSYTFSTTISTAAGTWSIKLSVTDSSSIPQITTSNTADIIVNPALAPPEVTATPNAVAQNQASTLSSSPVTTGTPSYTYQWFQKAPEGDYTTVGTNSPTYTFPGSTTTGTWTFLLQVTDSTGASVNSPAAYVTVSYIPPVFTIIVTQGAHGAINPGTTSVTLGSTQSFIITPDEGYQITDVLVDGISVGAVTSHTFTDVTANHQLTAVFTQIEYNLVVSMVGNGSVTKSPDLATYHYGDVVQLTAIPAAGWRFSVWTSDLTGPVNPSSITINGNKVVTATFVTNQYTITASAGSGGSISPPGTTIVDQGGSQDFNITPNAGYYIVDVMVNGTSVGPVSSYTISNIAGDTTITATFAPGTLTIETSAGPNGSINPNGIVTVTYGTDQSFTISPDIGYHITDVTVDGLSVGPATSYTFTAVTANHNITANFAITQTAAYYFINVTSPHGSPTPSAQINAGDSFTASVTDTEGDTNHRWICTGYSIDGNALVPGTNCTFTNIQANHTIAFNWQEQYHLTATSPFGSTTGTGWYNTGTAASVSVSGNTINSDSGTRQTFTGWTGDATGTSTTSNPITMDNAKTATATWTTQYQVTYATSGSAPYVTVPPPEWVNSGATATGTFPTSTISTGNTRTAFISDNRPGVITRPTTITGMYQTQYLVTFTQNGATYKALGTIVTIFADTKTYEQLASTIWINSGSSVAFRYAETVESADVGIQFVLKGTNATSPLTINEPTTIYADYEPQTIFTLNTIAISAAMLLIPVLVAILLLTRRSKEREITPSANTGGSISPSTTQKIERGNDSAIFIITPHWGYRIADVVIDNAFHLGAVRTYKFTKVDRNHTISVTFCKN